MHTSLAAINSEAVAHLKASKHFEAIVAFDKLFKRLEKKHLTHADLHTCYNNRAAAFLRLQLYNEALQDSEQARKLAEVALKRCITHMVSRKLLLSCMHHKQYWQELAPSFDIPLFAGHLRLLLHMSSLSPEKPAPL